MIDYNNIELIKRSFYLSITYPMKNPSRGFMVSFWEKIGKTITLGGWELENGNEVCKVPGFIAIDREKVN